MFTYLRNKLLLLLLLVVCCTLCDGVYAESSELPQTQSPADKNKNSIELLQIGKVNITLTQDGEKEGNNITVNDYYSPVIVSAGDVLLALAGVNRTNEENDKNVTIISKYIVTAGKDNSGWGSKVVSNSADDTNGEWKTQFVVQGKLKDGETSVVKGMLGAAKESKIYVLLVNCSNTNGEDSSNDAKCDLNITIGAISNGGSASNKKITWNYAKTNNVDQLTTKFPKENSKPYLFGGTAFTTKDNNVVFVLLSEDKEKKKNVFVVIYSEDDKTETKFKVSKVESVVGCTPSFFLWEEKKIIMIPTYCSGENQNTQKVRESSDLGSNWSDSTGPFARLLDFMQDKSDFTTTKINNTNVLLFTQKKLTKTGNSITRNETYVWFTDGNRVKSAGRILTDDNITSASLLHTNSELFALHQNWGSDGKQKNITLTRMEEQLGNITSVVAAWKNSDAIVQQLFKTAVPSFPTFNATDGLVGFLSGNNEGNNNSNWIDEYLYVNATVTNGERVDGGGLKFEGAGKNAKWPVGEKKENQPYDFTDPGFTLVANVTINAAGSGKDNSVMGVGYNESDKSQKTVGLLCTQGGEWKLTWDGDKSEKEVTTGNKCQQGSAYLVTLILNKNKLSVYIDGEELNVKENKKIKIDKTHNITHFYFGTNESQNGVESHVTVRNVLLYNRPFSHEEVEKLRIIKQDKPKKSSSNSANHTDSQERTHGDGKTTGGSSGGNGDNSDTTDKDTKIADMTSSSPSQPESSTLCGGIVGVLIISLLFGLHGYHLQ